MQRTLSREYLSPSMYSTQRQATLGNAIISLITTILGGGVLSLPYTFSKTGIIAGYLLLGLIAVSSDFSIYMLISSSRRIQSGHTYEDIAYYAFGKHARIAVCILLFILTYLCIIAYLLLIRDLVTSLAEFIFSTQYGYTAHVIVMCGTVVILSPLCMQHTLTALKSASTMSMISLIVLGVTIAYRVIYEMLYIDDNCYNHNSGTVQHIQHTSTASIDEYTHPIHTGSIYEAGDIKFFPDSVWDLVYAFPIMAVTYLCHFNVLPLHSELMTPTRSRVKQLIHGVIALCTSMYIFIGTMGYLHARNKTDGNILNNFDSSDSVIALGRAGLAFTCSCTFPLLVLPCKKVLNRLINMAYQSYHNYDMIDDADNNNTGTVSIQSPLLTHSTTTSPRIDLLRSSINIDNLENNNLKSYQHNIHMDKPSATYHDVNDNQSDLESELNIQTYDVEHHDQSDDINQPIESIWSWNNIIQTYTILFTVLIIACNITSVATLWSIVGSSISLVITFILPSAMYLKIRQHKSMNRIKLMAWLLLVSSTIAMCICTMDAIVAVMTPTPLPQT